jgi:5-methylcytosine-specific restriction endonuclease McrA
MAVPIGFKHSESSKKKMSLSRKGRKFSESHKFKISKALKGKPKSKEAVRKMALTKIGNTYNKGRKHSEATRRRMSIAKKGWKMPKELRIAIGLRSRGNKNMLGKRHSKETKAKMSAAHRGEKHHNWRGGVTKLKRRIRNSYKYAEWRSEGFERDRYQCLKGGKNHGSKLHFDHIKPFAVILHENNIKTLQEAFQCAELWDVDNGRTLCEKCHHKTDTWGTKTMKLIK